MYSAIIKKKKSEKANETKKVNPSLLKGIDEIEFKPNEGTMKIEPKPFEGAKKVPASSVPSAKKAKSEDVMSIDLMMQSAKKKKSKDNATSSEGENFEVDKDDKGMWKESGVSKEAYLKKIKKLKGY